MRLETQKEKRGEEQRFKERRGGGPFDLLSLFETCGTFSPEDAEVILIQGLVKNDQAQPLLPCKRKKKRQTYDVKLVGVKKKKSSRKTH